MKQTLKLCQEEKYAKFYYASQKMFFESKIIKLTTYFLATIPIILSLINATNNKTLIFALTMVSFSLNLIIEFSSTFTTAHKEKAILLSQMYESGITSNSFSKVQYDREMTNELNELAIRKSASRMVNLKEYHDEKIPEQINPKYSYLYLCRKNAADTNYLMSRMYGFYIVVLTLIIILFTSFAFIKNDTYEFLQLIIQFYPLVIPIIRNINGCQKTRKYCTKISADIDNFFAEKNKSGEELARFLYYTQNIEFESMLSAPAKYVVFYKVYSHGLKTLERGVTKRFIEASNDGKKIKSTSTSKTNKQEPVKVKAPTKAENVTKAKIGNKEKEPSAKMAKNDKPLQSKNRDLNANTKNSKEVTTTKNNKSSNHKNKETKSATTQKVKQTTVKNNKN